MNQNYKYEMDNSDTLENSSDSFFWQLTAKEKKLFKILSETSDQTIIGLSIHSRLSGRSLGRFRDMIKELNEQRLVAKKELIRSIGSEAVDLIGRISCK